MSNLTCLHSCVWLLMSPENFLKVVCVIQEIVFGPVISLCIRFVFIWFWTKSMIYICTYMWYIWYQQKYYIWDICVWYREMPSPLNFKQVERQDFYLEFQAVCLFSVRWEQRNVKKPFLTLTLYVFYWQPLKVDLN